MKLSEQVLTFASGNKDLFEQFQDYWNHYQALELGKSIEYDKSYSFAEKEDKINKALKLEIIRRSRINYAGDSQLESWFNHPLVRYESFAIIGALVDMILPQSIIEHIGLYTDVRQGGFGDSFVFDIEPRDLFVVSKAGRARKNSEIYRQFKGQVAIVPEAHQLTIGDSLYRVLSGADSFAFLTTKIIRSIETQMSGEVYTAFETAMAAVSSTATTGLQVSGYTQASLVRLAGQVTTWNQGAKAVIVGTQLALVNVLPTDANYRYYLTDDFVKVGYVQTAFGYDVLALPPVANIAVPFGINVISDDYIWIISPSSQKLLKLCLEGTTLAYTNAPFENANLSQNTTMIKSWGVGVATNSVAGVIAL